MELIKRTNTWYAEQEKVGGNLYVEKKYRKHSVPVQCASKEQTYVDAATGRRLRVCCNHSGCREYFIADDKKAQEYFIGKTVKTYYARVYDLSEKELVIKVYSSNSVKTYGLEWNKIFEARMGINGEINEKGVCSLAYWVSERSSKFLGEQPLLETPINVNPHECIRTLWEDDDPQTLIDEVWGLKEPSMEDFVKSWISGSLLEKAIERRCRYNFRGQPFGVELEFFGMKRSQAARIVAATLGAKKTKRNGQTRHYTYEIVDSRDRNWRVIFDGSINPTGSSCKGNRNNYKCELVTPILKYQDIMILQAIVTNLKKEGMIVNDSCGIHVHVSADGHTAKSLSILVKMMATHESLLFKALGVNDARYWACKKVEPMLLDAVGNKNKCGTLKSISQMKAIWYGSGILASGAGRHYDSSRYHALNLCSVWQNKGIEFRLFNSTTNADQVKADIQLCLAISMLAKNQDRASVYSWSNAGDKVRMRQWLVRLGLTGAEFKTVRSLLTKNL